MIVIGLDVHKQSVTAAALDEAGRELERWLSRESRVSIEADR
jgi:hypothetical protein